MTRTIDCFEKILGGCFREKRHQMLETAISLLSRSGERFSILDVLEVLKNPEHYVEVVPEDLKSRFDVVIKEMQGEHLSTWPFRLSARLREGQIDSYTDILFESSGRAFEMVEITTEIVTFGEISTARLTFTLLIDNQEFGTFSSLIKGHIITPFILGFEGNHLPRELDIDAPGYMSEVFKAIDSIDGIFNEKECGWRRSPDAGSYEYHMERISSNRRVAQRMLKERAITQEQFDNIPEHLISRRAYKMIEPRPKKQVEPQSPQSRIIKADEENWFENEEFINCYMGENW